MDGEWDRGPAAWDRQASVVAKQLLPGMTVTEAQAIVDRYPELSLRAVDADNPIITLAYRPGRIDVFVRNGLLVGKRSGRLAGAVMTLKSALAQRQLRARSAA